ncbi:MAG: hypothetical protein AAFP19_21395 [Bacteroidota bacterium]
MNLLHELSFPPTLSCYLIGWLFSLIYFFFFVDYQANDTKSHRSYQQFVLVKLLGLGGCFLIYLLLDHQLLMGMGHPATSGGYAMISVIYCLIASAYLMGFIPIQKVVMTSAASNSILGAYWKMAHPLFFNQYFWLLNGQMALFSFYLMPKALAFLLALIGWYTAALFWGARLTYIQPSINS